MRLTDPLFTSSTQNQREIVSGGYRQPVPPKSTNVASASQGGAIQRNPLPQPTTQAYRPVEPSPTRIASVEPDYRKPQPYTPPKP
ncbi:MAG TPA: hypothetical protein VKN63_01480, partial [Afifellaceae bacterium]|nr:hypothetical protein [Afifellaceae bacterium]